MVIPGHQKCAVCKHDHDFELDTFLMDEIRSGNCVIFAGAGISTESSMSSPHSLYSELAAVIGDTKAELPFPDLAERVCQRADGRFQFMKIVQERFNYIDKFRDLAWSANRFHSELATMPYFSTIITTNWDRYFETCCAAKPFVYDPDMRFWDLPRRKVLKIHGTIDDYSSIVATRTDYSECLARLKESLIGAKLKECLASKTCIFVGYSLRDDDLKEIFAFVNSALGKFSKQHYLVSPHTVDGVLPAGINQIVTDGTFFLKVVKSHICDCGCYLPDSIYDEIEDELDRVRADHFLLWEDYGRRKLPQMLASAFYQDGLQHGYKMVLDGRKTGRFSWLHESESVVLGYESRLREYKKLRRYDDVAYFRGYRNAFLGLALFGEKGEFLPAPRFYFEAPGEMTRSTFMKSLSKLPELHKAAYKRLNKISAEIQDGLVLHHPPWG